MSEWMIGEWMDAKKKGWMQKQGGRDVRRVCNDGWMDGWMDG